MYDDGWAWNGLVQGYIQMSDLSEDWIRDTEDENDVSASGEDNGIEISVNEDKSALEIIINGSKVTVKL